MPDELEPTWEAVRAELRRSVTDVPFHLWVDPLELASCERDVLLVRAPGHIKTLIEERYLPVLRRAARGALGKAVSLEIVGEDWSAPDEPRTAPGPAGSAARRDAPFNPKYTFDQFVIGDGNRLAHAAALAVAEMPGQAYNPLFLHGPPGLGKTHLLHAIGNYVSRHGDGLAVRYATVETFTEEFVRAVRGPGTEGFKGRFRGADVLLIDDVQFLAGKAQTKHEFFHTFNALYESGGQLVISSDRSPGDMDDFEARLRERFQCGLVAGLDPPALDVRLAILRKRASLDRLTGLDEETLVEVARQVTTSVRALEGALIRVVAYASLRGEAATPAVARELLARLGIAERRSRPQLGQIQAATARAFAIKPDALIARDRRANVALARQAAMYLARELTEAPLPEIGAEFGGRNHSTVLHAHRSIERRLQADESLAQTVDDLRNHILAA